LVKLRSEKNKMYSLKALLSKKEEQPKTILPSFKQHVEMNLRKEEGIYSNHDFQSIYGAKLKAKI